MSVDFAFLDSGTGGLPYMKRLLEMKKDAKCIYVGDTKNFPYGEKSQAEIIEKSCQCAGKIIEKWQPETLVVACNTISVTALEELRRRYPSTPFIGTVPAIKPAALVSKSRKIGLLATNATVNHPYTKRLISDFASDCTIVSRGDPDLISFIEHKAFSSSPEEQNEAVLPAINFFKENGCDVIVLACTHFLNMAHVFERVAGDAIKIVDSRDGVARHALEVHQQYILGKKDQPQAKALSSEAGEAIEDCSREAGEKSAGEAIDGSYWEPKLFVTGFTRASDQENYEIFCKNNRVKFGGLL